MATVREEQILPQEQCYITVAREEGWEDGVVREFGMDVYTLLYLKWITNKDLLYSTSKSVQCFFFFNFFNFFKFYFIFFLNRNKMY